MIINNRNRSMKKKAENRDNLLRKIENLKPWWHKIELGDGVVTPGGDHEWVWDPIRRLMDKIDYSGKKVLDLGSWDGLWAFEAEQRGASMVVATDARLLGYENFLFAKAMLDSQVIPFYGLPVQHIKNRLAISGIPEHFDIVQHFGLFYHLRDPLLSLSQSREILSDDGLLLLETAYIDDDVKSYMAFSGLPGTYHFYDASDTWAPTKRCLREILIRTFLDPVNERNWQYAVHPKLNQKVQVGRISMMAKMLPKSKGSEADRRKVFGA